MLRRAAFVLTALVLVAVILELGGFAAWWVATGGAFTFGRAAALRAEAAVGFLATTSVQDEQTRRAQEALLRDLVIHPFLGYVADGTAARDPVLPVSPFGFVDDAPPLRRRSPDRFVVGVVGGSVALQHALYAGPELAAALRRSPALAEREIEIVRLALGGYRQPQQLLTVQLLLLLGGEFDCIVNIDGFNEVALVEENVPLGVPAWFPRQWARFAERVPTLEQQLRLGHLALLRQQRREAAEDAATLWFSPLRQFLWLVGDRDLVAQIGALQVEITHADAEESFVVTGPGTGGQTVAEGRADMVALWRRASRDLHALCARHGILYCHFLQPNQYVEGGKPIGPAEASVALRADQPWHEAVRDAWPQLRAAGEQLRADGVPFVDLSMIFRDHPEPLYVDACCHFGKSGHVIMAEHVAAAVRRQLEQTDVTAAHLDVRPRPLVLTSPLAVQLLQVLSVGTAGRETDVSGVGFGVRMHGEPAGHLAVSAGGAVRATRRGAATLHVAYGQAAADVPVEADWPDLFTGTDGVPGPDGSAPRLLLDSEELAAGRTELTARCLGLPQGLVGLLVIGEAPLPANADGQVLRGMRNLVVTPDDDSGAATATVRLGTLGAQPLFLRLYVLDMDGHEPVAASPTVVVTGER